MTKCDVVVVGSGAGGSVMAYRLARAGLKVIVLERGRREDTSTFVNNEYDMLPRLYKHGGIQTTADNGLAILQGQTVGGSTVVNNAIWLRADLDRLLPSWQSAGAHVERSRLEAAYADLERALHVAPVPPDLMNAGTGVFQRGCAALGLKSEGLSHNRDECLGCGFCNYGCKYDRKTSMLVTFIPWAEARGATVIDQVRHVKLRHKGDRVTAVEFERFGRRQALESAAVVVACGAIGSSELLLRSQIRSQAPIGHGFHVLGGVLLAAEVREKLDGYDRIGLTCRLTDTPEYVVETFFAPPAAFAASINGFMDVHARRMQRYAYMAEAGVMVGTAPTGKIHLKDDQLQIDLKFSNTDLARLKRGIKQLSRIFFAGGATTVYPGTYVNAEFHSPADADKIDGMVKRADDFLLGSAHPQGGNPMSEDPKRGVVDLDFRVRAYANLFVADASVFPTNLWTNCQATVMAMSYLAADSVLRSRAA